MPVIALDQQIRTLSHVKVARAKLEALGNFFAFQRVYLSFGKYFIIKTAHLFCAS
jgi:hypothetical protein